MNPTPEQLRDPAYWRENAPKGTTHCYESISAPRCWEKWEDGEVYEWNGKNWRHFFSESQCVKSIRIPWPRPEPTLWRGMQDGLPPEGTRCQVINSVGGIICSDATITYQGAGVGCYVNNDNGMEYSVSHRDYSFRAIPSERDKSAADMAAAMVDELFDLGGPFNAGKQIHRIEFKYWEGPIERASGGLNRQALRDWVAKWLIENAHRA